MSERARIIDRLRDGLEPDAAFRAAWLGGADANNRADELSDVDLMCIIEEGASDHCLKAVRQAAESIAPIASSFRIPPPTWHGGDQEFFLLEGLGFAGLIDAFVITHREPFEFLVPERHGTPVVLFDRDGLVRPTPIDWDEHNRKLAAAVDLARGKLAVLGDFPVKEALRDNPAGAMTFYQSLVLQPLITILRAVHCPARYDFGFRYLDTDLPPDLHAAIDELCFPRGIRAMEPNLRRVRELAAAALAEYDARGA